MDKKRTKKEYDETGSWGNICCCFIGIWDCRYWHKWLWVVCSTVIPDHVCEPSVAFGTNQDGVRTSQLTLHPNKTISNNTEPRVQFAPNSSTPRKGPRKRSFRSVVPFPQLGTLTRETRVFQKAAVLPISQHEKRLKATFPRDSQSRVQLLEGKV
jgi:hypothetical protein